LSSDTLLNNDNNEQAESNVRDRDLERKKCPLIGDRENDDIILKCI
jgi:hypothetical protein